MDLLRIRNLDVVYGGAVTALRGVDLTVPSGAVVAVLGGNGAGKTTLLRAVSGTLAGQRGAITGGEITFDDESLVGRDPAAVVRRGVVQVPEGRRVFADLTVEENLRAGGYAVDRATRREARERVYDLFPILADRRNQPAGLMSGGEQQMLAIGRALMGAPRLLLLDEPSLGLAPQLVEQIGTIITTINGQGTAVLLIEQNAAMGLAVADHAVVLEVGSVAAAAPAAELAQTEEVRHRYLGVGGGQPDASPPPDSEAPTPSRPVQGQAAPLVVQDVTVRFGGITALDAVSFTVRPGVVHALIGPNGAGKSTCINVLSGICVPSSGTVRYGEDDLTSAPPHRIAALGVARTFQNLSLSPTFTVLDSLMVGRHRLMRSGLVAAGLGLRRSRREERAHRDTARHIGALLGLTDQLEEPIQTLPYGDRKRVELARALCAEPDVLLLDEPVAGMNHAESQAMARAILEVRGELGISILVVEHDMTFVMGIADHVTVLDFGRRIADGDPAAVQADPAVIAAYLGGVAA